MKRNTQESSRVTNKCRSCIYRTYMGAGRTMENLACYYAAITEEVRGCPAGDQCTKYVKGAPLPTKNEYKRW